MSSLDVPVLMKAVVTQPNRTALVQQVPVAMPGDDEILVRVKTIAINPTDWKHLKFICNVGTICGADYAGEVVKIGPRQDPNFSLKVGDRVAGIVHGGVHKDQGAFAEYVKADAAITWKIPDSISYEEAVTVSVGVLTCIQAMFHPKRLGLVQYPNQVPDQPWILIYGGSTAVGHYAIQLARLSGFRVVTTASPRNHGLMRRLGAKAVFNYRDPNIVRKIKDVTGDSVHIILDAYSEEESQLICIKAFGPGGGRLMLVQHEAPYIRRLRKDVTVQSTILYSVFGRPYMMMGKTYEADPADRVQLIEYLRTTLPEHLRRGLLRPMKVHVWDGGLENVADGFQYMIQGRVSAEKLVLRLT